MPYITYQSNSAKEIRKILDSLEGEKLMQGMNMYSDYEVYEDANGLAQAVVDLFNDLKYLKFEVLPSSMQEKLKSHLKNFFAELETFQTSIQRGHKINANHFGTTVSVPRITKLRLVRAIAPIDLAINLAS